MKMSGELINNPRKLERVNRHSLPQASPCVQLRQDYSTVWRDSPYNERAPFERRIHMEAAPYSYQDRDRKFSVEHGNHVRPHCSSLPPEGMHNRGRNPSFELDRSYCSRLPPGDMHGKCQEVTNARATEQDAMRRRRVISPYNAGRYETPEATVKSFGRGVEYPEANYAEKEYAQYYSEIPGGKRSRSFSYQRHYQRILCGGVTPPRTAPEPEISEHRFLRKAFSMPAGQNLSPAKRVRRAQSLQPEFFGVKNVTEPLREEHTALTRSKIQLKQESGLSPNETSVKPFHQVSLNYKSRSLAMQPPSVTRQRHLCLVCKKEYATKGTLVRHARLHEGKRPYECKFCKKKFAQKSNHKQHVRTHTGERPYKCLMCLQTFREATKFEEHLQIDH
mmetsp:Transcript_4684/g.6634  ORF Transcript_4684/g.6634 Transcript_4684/m.6634 type:complete len:391 (-) Transcript_4684:300-1472(-)